MTPYEDSQKIHAALKERGIEITQAKHAPWVYEHKHVMGEISRYICIQGRIASASLALCPWFGSADNSLAALRALGCSLKLNGHEWSVATTDGRVYFQSDPDDASALFSLLKKVLGVE